MKPLHSVLLVAVAVLVPLPGYGSPNVAVNQAQSKTKKTGRTIVITEHVEEYDIYVTPGKPVVMAFHSQILDWAKPDPWQIESERLLNSDVIEVFAPKGTPSSAITGHIRVATRLYTALIDVHSAETAEKTADGAITIKHKDAIAITEAGIEARAQLLAGKIIKKKEAEHAKAMGQMHERVDDVENNADARADDAATRASLDTKLTVYESSARDLIKPTVYRPVRGESNEGPLTIRFGDAKPMDDHWLVSFDAQGSNAGAFAIDAIEAYDQYGTEFVTHLIKPARSERPNNALPVIAAGATKTMVVAIASDPERDHQPTRLVLKSKDGAKVVASLSVWKQIYRPHTQETMRKDRERTQLMLSPQVLRGYFWISNGLEQGQGRELESTTFTGFGLRLTKGISDLVAFEASVSGGFTGDAKFDMDAGQMTRTGKFGRIQGGILARFGLKWIPTARVGLGLQGTSYDSAVPGGMEPDDGLEFGGLLSFGGGVDYRMSEHFVMGVAVSAVFPLGGDSKSFGQTIAAGAHIGYGWTPDYEGD